jgi:hypothetical protein
MALASLAAISGPKKVSISGPTPSNGPRNGYCLHQIHYVPRHINNRDINSYFNLTIFQNSKQNAKKVYTQKTGFFTKIWQYFAV